MAALRLWMRSETNPFELRAPIAPSDVALLVADGIFVTVEESPQRIFPAAEYAATGAVIVAADSWPEANQEEVIIGLKSPGSPPFALRHRHAFFGHAYKGQQGGDVLLRRFAAGGGTLLDLECLVDDTGRRVAAFGYWAGYAGAALAVLHCVGQLEGPLHVMSQPELDAALEKADGVGNPRALVIGALGRCGTGAVAALSRAGVATTSWDLPETKRLDRAEILGHDLLVNCVQTMQPAPPFLRPQDVADSGRELSTICDVTCDVTSDCNLLPVYDQPTQWTAPVRRLCDDPPLDLIAIDNLPSLLPREASIAFSAALRPHLQTLGQENPVWRRARQQFDAASSALRVHRGKE